MLVPLLLRMRWMASLTVSCLGLRWSVYQWPSCLKALLNVYASSPTGLRMLRRMLSGRFSEADGDVSPIPCDAHPAGCTVTQ